MTRNLKWLMVLLVLAALVGMVNASTVYYLSDDNSGLSNGVDFNKILNATTETAGTTGSISIAKDATEVSYAYTNAGIPYNADWATGAATVKVNVTTAPASPYIALSMNLERINSAGTLQESATATAEQTINAAGVYTFNIASKDWTAGAATDRIRLKYSFRNIKTNGALTVTLATGQANMGVTTEIGIIPNAAFSANVTTGSVPLAVKFTDASTNSPTTWSWYWGADETLSSSTQSPEATFTNSGVYNVRLYASNAAGGTWNNKTAYITIWDATFQNTSFKGVGVTADDTFTKMRNGAGTNGVDIPIIMASTTSNIYNVFGRGVFTYNTSSIPDGATITGAQLVLYISGGSQAYNDFASIPSMGVTGGTVIDPLVVSVNDYQRFTDVDYATRLPYADIPKDPNGNLVTFTLVEAGLANVSKTGYTVLFVRWSNDIDNSSPTWGSEKNMFMGVNGSILKVSYTTSAPVTPIASFTTNVTTGTAPTAVLFTDTSTNTPTSWSYSAKNLTPGNNTWFQVSTSQSLALSFGVGNWSLNLTATNSAGSNISTQTTWLNVSPQTAVAPVASFTVDKTTIRFPNSIACTDTSTNTPTSWQWQWGDGTANSTTQNPTHQYTRRGTYIINMAATNDGGTGVASPVTVRVIGYQDNFT